MLKSLEFKSYKAFAEGKIEFPPITIFLGNNSSGKSSLLQLLLLISQTSDSEGIDGAFRLNGSATSLGEARNLLHFRDENSAPNLTFNIDPIGIPELTRSFCQEILVNLGRGFVVDAKANSLFQKAAELYGSQKPGALKSLLTSTISLLEYIRGLRKNDKKIKARGVSSSNAALSKITKNNFASEQALEDGYRLLKTFDRFPVEFDFDNISYTFHFNKLKSDFEIRSISIRSGQQLVLEYSVRRSNGRPAIDLRSDFMAKTWLEKYRLELKKNLILQGLSASPKSNRYAIDKAHSSESYAVRFLARLIQVATDHAIKGLRRNQIKHVSPIRAFPQRYYMIGQGTIRDPLNTKSGDSLAETLKRKPTTRTHVNKWLRNFKLAIDIEGVNDIVHSIKVRQNNINLDLTDVGFGISQILPVIVQGFLAEENSITLIEQPEIHLHPKMQADLADLFIDIVRDTHGRLLIETHSEYMLKRLRRRMAEGKVSPEDVAIYVINSNETSLGSTITRVNIEPKGAFPWPRDFSETEFEDTLAFARLQSAGD